MKWMRVQTILFLSYFLVLLLGRAKKWFKKEPIQYSIIHDFY